MTSNERLIIRDYLIRKRGYFIGGFVIHLIMMTWCWWSGTPIILGIIGGSAFILAFDQEGEAKGVKRTMQSLPITANQLARSWRFVALGFPLIFFMVALLLSTMIGAAFGASYLTMEFFLLIAISQTLSLGFCFYAMTGFSGPSLKGGTLWLRIQDIFFVVLCYLSLPAVIYLSYAFSRNFTDLNGIKIATLTLLAVASVAGWFRADLLVYGRTFRAKSNRRKAKKESAAQTMKSWNRFGALPYLFARDTWRTLAIIICFMISLEIIDMWCDPFASNSRPSSEVPNFVIVILAAGMVNNDCSKQLRILRTMPLSTSVLTNLLVFWPLGLAIFAWLIAQLFHSSLNVVPIDWKSFSQSLAIVTIVLIQLPLTLRLGQLGAMIFFGTIFASTMILPVGSWLLGDDSANSPWLFTLTCILLPTIWCSTYRLLGTPHPWRAGP